MKRLIRRILFPFVRTYYVFNWKKYERIVVSGSQRSGTTIVSQMIANDLGYRNIDESEFGIHDYKRFIDMLALKNVVIQCPALTHRLQDIAQPSTLIIWMDRPYHEIRKSMERINWDKTEETFEKQKYFGLETVNYELPIERIKHNYWKTNQKNHLKCDVMELNYHGSYIKLHPSFLSKKNRVNLSSKQTRLS